MGTAEESNGELHASGSFNHQPETHAMRRLISGSQGLQNPENIQNHPVAYRTKIDSR
jgi:hypothetical protein